MPHPSSAAKLAHLQIEQAKGFYNTHTCCVNYLLCGLLATKKSMQTCHARGYKHLWTDPRLLLNWHTPKSLSTCLANSLMGASSYPTKTSFPAQYRKADCLLKQNENGTPTSINTDMFEHSPGSSKLPLSTCLAKPYWVPAKYRKLTCSTMQQRVPSPHRQ